MNRHANTVEYYRRRESAYQSLVRHQPSYYAPEKYYHAVDEKRQAKTRGYLSNRTEMPRRTVYSILSSGKLRSCAFKRASCSRYILATPRMFEALVVVCGALNSQYSVVAAQSKVIDLYFVHVYRNFVTALRSQSVVSSARC